MPGDDVLTHRNHGGQAIIIQRHAQRTEVVVAIEDARVLVLHSLQTAQRFQRGFHWDSSDAQIEVERVTRKHQVSLVIDKHHLTGRCDRDIRRPSRCGRPGQTAFRPSNRG